MNTRQQLAMDRVGKIEEFLRSQRLIGLPPLYTATLTELGGCMNRMRVLFKEQSSTSRELGIDGRRVRQLRHVIRRQYMIPLARAGRPLLRFAAGVERALIVPHARASNADVVAAAEHMVEALRPHRKLFVSGRFSPTVLTELRTQARELHRLTTTSGDSQRRRAAASRGLRTKLTRAGEVVRVLESLLFGRIESDELFRGLWRVAVRMPKRLGRPKRKVRARSVAEPESVATA
jgi:hypothetical protein